MRQTTTTGPIVYELFKSAREFQFSIWRENFFSLLMFFVLALKLNPLNAELEAYEYDLNLIEVPK